MFKWLENRITMGHELPMDFKMPNTLGKFIWYFASQIKGLLSAILVLELMTAITQMALPMLIGVLVAGYTSGNPQGMFHSSQFWWAAAFACIGKPAVMIIYRTVFGLSYNPFFANLARQQLYQYTLAQSTSFFQNDFAGRIASKIGDAGDSLRAAIAGLIGNSLYAGFVIISAAVLLSTVHWSMTILVLTWAIVYGWAGYHFIPRLRETASHASDLASHSLGIRVDAFTNITAVKLSAREEYERKRDNQAIHEHNAAILQYEKAQLSMMYFIELSSPVLLVGTIALCAYLSSTGAINVAQIAVVFPTIGQLMQMANWIMNQTAGVFENFGKVEDAMETLAKAHTVVDLPAAPALQVGRGTLQFCNATHRYGKDNGGINSINLVIPAGQKVGVVGRSGSGKTTFVLAIVRSFNLEGGKILIDGQNIAEVTQTTLRSSITVVSQDPSLLHRTVRENIAYSRPDATEEEIIAAAKAAHAHDFILGLEDPKGNKGYDAVVGERGIRLSGGQRQRISIARALLANNRIMILDEATSALDSVSENAIQENMAELLTGRTVIAIAHRLSTLQMMDRIIVMEQGKIVEDGAHKELLAQKGIYAKLWNLQTEGFLPAEAA